MKNLKLENDIIKFIIVSLIVIYCVFGIPSLNESVLINFSKLHVRIFIILVILVSAMYDPVICLMLSIAFILTHQKVQSFKNTLVNNKILLKNQNTFNQSELTNEIDNIISNRDDILNNSKKLIEENNNLKIENTNLENDKRILQLNIQKQVNNKNKNTNNDSNNPVLLADTKCFNNQDVIDNMYNYMSPNQVNNNVLKTNPSFYSERTLNDMSTNFVPNADQNQMVHSKLNSF